jgi:hypothetical protein
MSALVDSYKGKGLPRAGSSLACLPLMRTPTLDEGCMQSTVLSAEGCFWWDFLADRCRPCGPEPSPLTGQLCYFRRILSLPRSTHQ